MFCQDCEQPISTTDIVNHSLKRWKDTVIQGARAQKDGWILTFHFLQEGWTWLHIPSPIT
jgi:hypothetical protein